MCLGVFMCKRERTFSVSVKSTYPSVYVCIRVCMCACVCVCVCVHCTGKCLCFLRECECVHLIA